MPHRKIKPPRRHAGADQIRLAQRLWFENAIADGEIFSLEIHARLAPKALDDGGPFLGQVVTRIVIQGSVPGVHLLEFAAIGARHDIEPAWLPLT